MLRPFKEEDKEKLLDIFKLNIPTFFAEHEIRDYENYLTSHGETYFTVERNGRIVGGTGYLVKNGTGRITWIFFHP
tara:strand:- start:2258 stop:2485 length:228 start_codon:yes stop_codon:yes gene_type:complete